MSVDGMPLLQRNGYTTNGNLAVGDQTNDADLDAVTQIRSTSGLCR